VHFREIYVATVIAVVGGFVSWVLLGSLMQRRNRAGEAARLAALTPDERAEENLVDWANKNAW
jgi:hypothetical protein